jgi:hypothetical protein
LEVLSVLLALLGNVEEVAKVKLRRVPTQGTNGLVPKEVERGIEQPSGDGCERSPRSA